MRSGCAGCVQRGRRESAYDAAVDADARRCDAACGLQEPSADVRSVLWSHDNPTAVNGRRDRPAIWIVCFSRHVRGRRSSHHRAWLATAGSVGASQRDAASADFRFRHQRRCAGLDTADVAAISTIEYAGVHAGLRAERIGAECRHDADVAAGGCAGHGPISAVDDSAAARRIACWFACDDGSRVAVCAAQRKLQLQGHVAAWGDGTGRGRTTAGRCGAIDAPHNNAPDRLDRRRPLAAAGGRHGGCHRRPKTDYSHASTAAAQETPARPPVDILDLPRPGSNGTNRGAAIPAGAGGVRVASDTAASTGRNNVLAASGGSAADAALYGYDTNYVWLRGKLEYAQADGQWKLRYIPVDTDSDGYGGSVVISNAAALSGYERGDLVEVRGRVQLQQAKKGFAPPYEVSEIKPLRRATP